MTTERRSASATGVAGTIPPVAAETGTRAVDRALSVLHLFVGTKSSWTLTEVARASGFTVSTAHRLLKALLAHELIALDPQTRAYTLGVEVMRLARGIIDSEDRHRLQVVAHPELERLRDLSGETVGLHVRITRNRVCIAELSSPHALRLASTVGGVQPLHAGAASKALLAWLPDAQRADLLNGDLPRLTPLTITDAAVFDSELQEIRQRGYAISQGESVAGASAASAPIFGMDGSVVAVINVTGPIDRFDRTAINAIAPDLLNSTKMISEQLGFQPHED